ncbi:hypothetical protein ACFOLF_03925 [Paenibacillus sepulcri]|uniref:Uncharacterized protein n=1 Tax=Paenibacillus sepulcri TaxID=359917 RepID=A0ABS7C8K7_9BACL|nr:hypothetical protein [Paenibacillus sepulcri]
MVWSELRAIPNEYNDQIKLIDEKLLSLIKERKALTGNRRFFPPWEQVQAWGEQFQMADLQISYFFQNIQERTRPVMPDSTGDLKGVVSIMKKVTKDHIDYILTHAMQHELVSVVYLEINNRRENADSSSHTRIKANLTLEIIGDQDYAVRRSSMGGNGAQTTMTFHIAPALPDDLKTVEFSLIPAQVFPETSVEEIILDQQIDFI